MLRNTSLEYGSVAKFLHWLIALLIVLMLAVGFTFSLLSDQHSAIKSLLILTHKSLGLTLLLLVTLRLVWKLINIRPILPITVPLLERALAHCIHFCLYVVMFAMIFIGWTMSAAGGHNTRFWGLFNLNLPIPKNTELNHLCQNLHLIFAWVLIALIALHIVGALKHYFYNKNRVLQRMLPLHSIRKKSLFR